MDPYDYPLYTGDRVVVPCVVVRCFDDQVVVAYHGVEFTLPRTQVKFVSRPRSDEKSPVEGV